MKVRAFEMSEKEVIEILLDHLRNNVKVVESDKWILIQQTDGTIEILIPEGE